MDRSEVARLRRQIEAEYSASKAGLEGLAAVARHRFITARVENIGVLHEQLITLVGEQEAITILAETIWSPADQGTETGAPQ